ncbi:type IV secretion protein Rhs [Gryllotalpicola protaetiae]|uniref:Type IV secretion protein Rhs n=1 Tax=Gryllotalpicola protaetiae TaxID=2419771 RepID=A0A387BKM0_9MICO|nr:type IV secretion protein Rhs [Gryllotalpicola protaetiae]
MTTARVDYGHLPGYEWWRTQQLARGSGWTRQQVIEYENDPDHYQIESPSSNRSHLFEMPR